MVPTSAGKSKYEGLMISSKLFTTAVSLFLQPDFSLVDAYDPVGNSLNHFQIVAGKKHRQTILSGKLD
jgi:hypothetical protein